ncbi:TPA: HD domain-containing protein [Candidatus Micrarchaeota archaeon]|nr:HD domain-containing protein [Candidatus Micrarchaeota archaeon]
MAVAELKAFLPSDSGGRVSSAWQEYKAGVTEEAKFVKAFDKLETLMQLVEAGGGTYDRPGLIPNYADAAAFPKLEPLLLQVKKELKREFEKAGIP